MNHLLSSTALCNTTSTVSIIKFSVRLKNRGSTYIVVKEVEVALGSHQAELWFNQSSNINYSEARS